MANSRSRLCVMPCLLVAAGCVRIDVPRGFVRVPEAAGYDVKAVSARGHVFAVTSRPNEGGPEADLAYWTQAVEHHKVDLDGYRLEGRTDIESVAGMRGVLFDLRTGSGAAEYTYLIALFVTPRAIHTIEAAGPARQFADDRPSVEDAIKSIRI